MIALKIIGIIIIVIMGVACALALIAGVLSAIINEINFAKCKICFYHSAGFYEKHIKRPIDCLLATGALVVLSPLILVTAILVRINLGSPILFTQDRPGLIDGNTGKSKIFKMYKFRSMLNPKDGIITADSDRDRLTPFGKKLRSTSLDELPELFNIIKGDMAIVGPRPLLVSYLERYNNEQARRHEVRPGFTGLAQINGRNSISWEEKFNWDVKYVDDVTFLGDVRIIIGTVRTVLRREGISAAGEATMSEFMGSNK